MPFLGKSTKHRKYEHTGPYGPGAGFAIGSGDRLAARRRETAQIKALMRRYPGMLPHAMNAVAGGVGWKLSERSKPRRLWWPASWDRLRPICGEWLGRPNSHPSTSILAKPVPI